MPKGCDVRTTPREAGPGTSHAEWVSLYVSMGLTAGEAETLLADREAARALAAKEKGHAAQA